MIQFFKKIFSSSPKMDYPSLLKDGAVIVDVRTKGEFAGGHVKGAINIPLDTLGSNLSRLKKNKPVITCCASGMRSASARSILKMNGFEQVYNAGSWVSLNAKLN